MFAIGNLCECDLAHICICCGLHEHYIKLSWVPSPTHEKLHWPHIQGPGFAHMKPKKGPSSTHARKTLWAQHGEKELCPCGAHMKPNKNPSSTHIIETRWARYGEKALCPREAHMSPPGLTHVGPRWQPRRKLAGPQLGSKAGAHMSALMEPIKDPHGCAGWVVLMLKTC